MKNVTYTTTIEGNKVVIEKKYRTRTQFEYLLTIYIGESDFESILMYDPVHLTKKSALKEAYKAITSSKKPIIERVF